MISGTLTNSTVWWISRDGKKVWIESKDLEEQKFSQKGYSIIKDRIFSSKPRKQIGELTGSRLERRLYKDSWLIALNAFLDIYPDLIEEIGNKSIEEKKKILQTKSKKSKTLKTLPQIEIKKEKIEKDEEKQQEYVVGKLEQYVEQEKKEEKIIERSYFDTEYPYVEWIKEEIGKSPNGELKILADEMKEKMGKEYLNMHDMRIYFGLKKISKEIGVDIELGKQKGRSLLIIKRTEEAVI